jgi:tetratricopeptide (TPR) repeat protein
LIEIAKTRTAVWATAALVALSVTFWGCDNTDRRIEQGKEHQSLRQFDQARAAFQEVLKRKPEHRVATVQMALTSQAAREWNDSEMWWRRVLALEPDRRDALLGLWKVLWQQADSLGRDTLTVVVAAEVERLLHQAPDRLGVLTFALDAYGITGDSVRAKAVGDAIVSEFPASKEAYNILGSEFYDGLYPIWNDDEAKIEYLLKFIQERPQTVWRRTAYSWLLYSLHETGRLDSLVMFCRINANEFPNDPFALVQSAKWLLKTKQDIELGWKYAQTAVELERTAGRPDYYPEKQWALEKAGLFSNSRLFISMLYREMGKLDHAEKWLRSAIEEAPYTADDDQKPSAHWEVLAEICMETERYGEAIEAAVQCLIGGDRRNKWGQMADSALVEACNKTGRDPDQRHQIARELVSYQGPVFTDVTDLTGLGNRCESRVAWGDVNNDGYDDLLLGGRVLFINQKDGTFFNGTDAAGLQGSASGGVFGDYNNDGWLDFYATSSGTGENSDRLWRNGSDGTFEDVTESAGKVRDDVSTEGAAWGDFNGDGFLDLYVANYEKRDAMGHGTRDLFYINQGNGRFIEAADSVGMVPPFDENLCGRGVNWGDYDNDGDQDIFVSNYRLQENLLWENLGDGRAVNAALVAGVAGVERDGWWGHTIGSEWGDYDNDGDLDLITANLAHPRYIDFSNKTCLYENTGPPDWRFVDRRSEAGIKYEETHSDPAWGDVDNDGFLDLYITCIYKNMRSFLYRNKGDGTFEDVTYLSGTRAFNGWGCAFSDWDNDGDLDLLVASGSGVRLFRNDSAPKHWLQVKATGTKSNRAGIGARVELIQSAVQRTQIREIQGGHGTTSQHSLVAHFGLGDDDSPVRVSMRFPSGEIKVMDEVAVDQRVEVVE